MNIDNIIIGLDQVKVNTSELLEKLKKNRKTHKKDYLESMAEYRLCYIDAIEKTINEMENTIKELDIKVDQLNETIEVNDIKSTMPNLYFARISNLKLPNSNLDSYDISIDMIAASVDEQLVLTRAEFNQYWRDQWSWKESFEVTKEFYKKTAMRRK